MDKYKTYWKNDAELYYTRCHGEWQLADPGGGGKYFPIVRVLSEENAAEWASQPGVVVKPPAPAVSEDDYRRADILY